LLRSLQEIQPDFEEEAKAYAGLWSLGKNARFEAFTAAVSSRELLGGDAVYCCIVLYHQSLLPEDGGGMDF
jgi:hypothetical protein